MAERALSSDEILARHHTKERSKQFDAESSADILATARFMLSDVGLNLSDLRDKRVLDEGSGSGSIIARAAKLSGVKKIVSLDVRQEAFSERNDVGDQVAGSQRRLPFKNESFDLVVRRNVPFRQPKYNRQEQEEYERAILNEELRVLTQNGEARIMRAVLASVEDWSEEYRVFWIRVQGHPKTAEEQRSG